MLPKKETKECEIENINYNEMDMLRKQIGRVKKQKAKNLKVSKLSTLMLSNVY